MLAWHVTPHLWRVLMCEDAVRDHQEFAVKVSCCSVLQALEHKHEAAMQFCHFLTRQTVLDTTLKKDCCSHRSKP